MLLRSLLAISAAALLCSPCSADEMVLLKSGFTLRANSHTLTERGITFNIGGGSVELQPAEIERIELLPQEPTLPGPVQTPAAVLPAREDNEAILAKAARQTGLDASFVTSVAKAESGLSQKAISIKGARGLMQLMPGTAAALGVDPARSDQNALGGAKYLRELLIKYHNSSALALAAYNAGPGAVARYKGVPPYAETRKYIARVTREYDRQQKIAAQKPKQAAEAASSSTSKD